MDHLPPAIRLSRSRQPVRFARHDEHQRRKLPRRHGRLAKQFQGLPVPARLAGLVAQQWMHILLADGHAERKRWQHDDTLRVGFNPHEGEGIKASPGNPDIAWMQERATRPTWVGITNWVYNPYTGAIMQKPWPWWGYWRMPSEQNIPGLLGLNRPNESVFVERE